MGASLKEALCCASNKRSLKGLEKMHQEGNQRGLKEAQSCKGTLKGAPKGTKGAPEETTWGSNGGFSKGSSALWSKGKGA